MDRSNRGKLGLCLALVGIVLCTFVARLPLAAADALGAGSEGATPSAGNNPPSPPTTAVTNAALTGTGAQTDVTSQSVIPGSGTTPHRGRGASTSYCTFTQLDIANPIGSQGTETGPNDHPAGTTLWRSCFNRATGLRISGPAIYTTTEPGAPNQAVIQQQLIETALANLDIDLPQPTFSPPAETIPNFDTWMWTNNPTTLTATASIPGLSITATATLTTTQHRINPVDDRPSLDDDITITCTGPGTAYAQGATTDCNHKFHAPTRDLTIDTTATWNLSWAATNGNAGNLGTINRTTTTNYRLQEKRTVIRSTP